MRLIDADALLKEYEDSFAYKLLKEIIQDIPTVQTKILKRNEGEIMKDIKLLETCNKCGEHLTLMESINTDTNKLMLVTRCLKCGEHPVTEVVEVCGK